jgi:AbrB family looped-hinge helix DNA binding protein
MSVTVTIDRQGRIVVPLAERRRLGLEGGEVLALLPTPEGLLLERRREATVRTGPDGLPLVEFARPRPVTGAEALAAIRAHREER